VAQGLLAIRSHVDVCDPRLLAVDALLEVKRRVAPYLDLQLVAFPQDGVLRSPGALDLLKRAQARRGRGGRHPHFERTMADGAASVTLLCELAAEQGKRGHALRRATTRCRAMSRPWPSRPSAWACTAASPART
jgi:cytosine deaminase